MTRRDALRALERAVEAIDDSLVVVSKGDLDNLIASAECDTSVNWCESCKAPLFPTDEQSTVDCGISRCWYVVLDRGGYPCYMHRVEPKSVKDFIRALIAQEGGE